MTRLIDADALLNRMQKDPLFDLVERYGVSGVINAEPTVEAVPVEFIRALIRDLDNSIMKYGGRFDYSASVDSWILRRGALEGLIKAAELEGLIEEED